MDNFKYYKVGKALIKAEYNKLGIKCTYVFDEKTKDFKIDNTFIHEIIIDDEVSELNKKEFDLEIKKYS